MNRIYTRTGDNGTTAIHGGERVAKTDARIEANGTIDELNVAVGSVRTALPADHEWQPMLRDIQLTLMTAMSLIATPSESRDLNPNDLPTDLISGLEAKIDTVNRLCSDCDSLILPGGTPLASLLHQARVTARRAERRVWALDAIDSVPELIPVYLNRLADLFFILARYELQQSGCREEIWRHFGYYRKKTTKAESIDSTRP